MFQSINPATGDVCATFPAHTADDVRVAIRRSVDAFQRWRRTSFAERAEILLRVAEALEADKERLSELMSLEMGKPHLAGIEEAEKSARGCRYYAENAARFLADEPLDAKDDERRFIAYEPLGPVLAIMPWNFPFWQVFRFAAPALMAGNTALLKHAASVPRCALAIEELFRIARLPDGAFQTLLIGHHEAESVIEAPEIRAVTLTGSDRAGAAVGSMAGKSLKKVVLELGGSDPFIVMPSADLDDTARMAVRARTINNGESCIAAKRFIVHESIADEFERKLVDGMKVLRVGDPSNPEIDIGPLATASIREGLARQVERSVQAGARVLVGGRSLPGRGYFYEPTVLANITRNSPAWHEEFFGPVALMFRSRSLEEAIAIANESPFGLGASLWSSDPREHEIFIRTIEAGMAFVNAQVASDPSMPFGGIKRSGHGRELSRFGIREFINVKTVVVRRHGATRGVATE